MLMMHRKWEKLHQEGRDEEVSWKFWQKQYSFREQYGVGLDPDELEGLWLRLQILGLRKFTRIFFGTKKI